MHILLIDDHPLYRQALGSHLGVLADETQMIEASSCAQALAAVPPGQEIDLVLLDIYLADENGLDRIRQLRDRFPGAPIVVISASEDATSVRNAVARGAEGYIPKSATAQVIRNALQIVMNGGTYVPAFAIAASSHSKDDGLAADERTHTAASLTARQLEILARLAQGCSNKHIAHELGVAESTVRAHVTQILKTLNVNNRTAAGYAATMRGLIKSSK